MSTITPAGARRRFRLLAAAIVSVASIVGLGTATGASTPPARTSPTVVLVHGAWADASSWAGVTAMLQERGYTVIAPANPLRGLASDSAYLASILATVEGPIVLAAHSYGGMVTTNAATGNTNITALVYLAAFAPNAGESLGALGALNPGSMLIPENLTFRPYEGGADVYITPSVFAEVFAADVPASTAAVMAAAQRPIAAAILEEPSGDPAWAHDISSWYLVATQDMAIPPATQQFMAERADATIVEVESSHTVTVSHPDVVTDLIIDAATP